MVLNNIPNNDKRKSKLKNSLFDSYNDYVADMNYSRLMQRVSGINTNIKKKIKHGI